MLGVGSLSMFLIIRIMEPLIVARGETASISEIFKTWLDLLAIPLLWQNLPLGRHMEPARLKSFPSQLNLPALQLLHLIDFWGIHVHMSLIPLQLEGTSDINIPWTLCFISAVCLRVRSEKRSEWHSRNIQHHTWKEKHGVRPNLEGCDTAAGGNKLQL